ncbi:MAG: PrsW family intramembrane metalloprotease, partial [Cytophagales bacterium]|nr:PrsW family intramembrane metalloprotease [Cytophagales bacterium]
MTKNVALVSLLLSAAGLVVSLFAPSQAPQNEFGVRHRPSGDELVIHYKFIADHWTSFSDQLEQLYPPDDTTTLGVFAQTCFAFQRGRFTLAIQKAQHVCTEAPALVHFLLGYSYLRIGNYPRAEEELEKAVLHHRLVLEDATKALAEVYEFGEQPQAIAALMAQSELAVHLPINYQKRHYLQHLKLGRYAVVVYHGISRSINRFGLMASVLITLAWLFYLRELDIFERESWAFTAVVCVAGMFFSLGTFLLSDVNNLILEKSLTGEYVNDLMYSIIGIGIIEELVKIIPVALVIAFSKEIDEPYDMIFYACVSALGFAFVENLVYFDGDHTEIIHSRAFTSVVGHMIFTSIVAYGFLLQRYRHPDWNVWIVFGAFFFMASVVHGVYDFLLIKKWMIPFFFYFILIIQVWLILINNAINNSKYFTYQFQIEADRIQSYLVLALTGILVVEYVAMAWQHGQAEAHRGLWQAVLGGSFPILFLATKLSRFDIVKNYWRQLTFSLMSIQNFVMNNVKPLNFVGHHVHLLMQGQDKPGVITERRILIHRDGYADTYWFEVELEEPLLVKNQPISRALISFQRPIIELIG